MPSDAITQDGANGLNSTFGGGSDSSAQYFKAVDKEMSFLGFSSSPYTVLEKTGSGLVDVTKDMYWSNVGNKDEVPFVFCVEKELQFGTWATQLSNLLTQTGAGLTTAGSFVGLSNAKNLDTFLKLYSAKPTGFKYSFPWLINSGYPLRSISNSWDDAQGLASLTKSFGGQSSSQSSGQSNNIGSAITGALGGAVMGALTPGFGFEDTKEYKSTSQQSITISFPLYNTLDLKSAFRHFSFVQLFTFQNLKTRTSLMTFIPPKIYEVDAYAIGGVYMPAAVVSELKIESIGTTRAMSDWFGFGANYILMPEAYKVSITFTDLLSQSSNVFAGTLGGSKISITDGGALTQSLVDGTGAVVKTAGNFLGKVVNTVAGTGEEKTQ
jgi:hypothetical protein